MQCKLVNHHIYIYIYIYKMYTIYGVSYDELVNRKNRQRFNKGDTGFEKKNIIIIALCGNGSYSHPLFGFRSR